MPQYRKKRGGGEGIKDTVVEAEKVGGDLLKGDKEEKFSWQEFRHAPPSEPVERERGKFSWAEFNQRLPAERMQKAREEKMKEKETDRFVQEFFDSVEAEAPHELDYKEDARSQAEEAEKRLTEIKRELEIKTEGVRRLESYLKYYREEFHLEEPPKK